MMDSGSTGLIRTKLLANEGFRVLAMAKRESDDPDAAPYEGLTFLGWSV